MKRIFVKEIFVSYAKTVYFFILQSIMTEVLSKWFHIFLLLYFVLKDFERKGFCFKIRIYDTEASDR